jgi:hypothetical protein
VRTRAAGEAGGRSYGETSLENGWGEEGGRSGERGRKKEGREKGVKKRPSSNGGKLSKLANVSTATTSRRRAKQEWV